MGLDKTALDVQRQLKAKGWIDPATKRVSADLKQFAYWMANVLDLTQSQLKPFAVTEAGQCYVWDPINETWNRCQLKDIYAAVRRDPTV